MVEVKALTAFTDKETGVFHKKGDSFSCEADRAKELAEKEAIVIVNAPTEDKPVEKKTSKRATKKK